MIVLCCLLLFFALCFIYARFIEPQFLELKKLTLYSEKAGDGLRVALLSDTHIGCGMDAEDLEKAVRLINEQNPDLVFLLGDLFDNLKRFSGSVEDVSRALMQLEGEVYAVFGNHDYGGGGKNVCKEVYRDAGVRLLINERVELEALNVAIVGSDDMIFGRPDVESLLSERSLTILLSHEPKVAKGAKGVDFQFSGHAHGGQVRLPFIRPFYLPQGVGEYVSGLFARQGGGQLYVSRGFGTTFVPIRFFARPEITIIDIKTGG